MRRKLSSLSIEERHHLDNKILSDLIGRSSTLCYFFAFAFTAYSFTSLDILRSFEPKISIWSNFWPRLLFNGIPFLFLAKWFHKNNDKLLLKANVAMIAIPLTFVIACFIHALPIMLNGGHQLYSYFHGPNVYIITVTMIITSPPPKFLTLQVMTFLLGFVFPLGFVFSNWRESPLMFHTFVGDYVLLFSITTFIAFQFYKLRLRVALADLETRKSASLFLGIHLADAIYDERNGLFEGYTQKGSILALDIRGYTNFVHTASSEVTKAFMHSYHELIAKTIGHWGGYIHKSSGDGHIISFGIMEKEEDLSDIPGIENESLSAGERKMKHILHHATRAFEEIVQGFEVLKKQNGIDLPMLVGAGLSFGEIEVVIRGDDKYRKELDIDGESIVRAVRLESYSKFLNKSISDDSSFLVISPEFEKSVDPKYGIRICYTQTKETAVRDYPWIKYVYFRQWKHNRARPAIKAA